MWCIKHSHHVSSAKQYALGICEQLGTLQDLGQTSHALIHLSTHTHTTIWNVFYHQCIVYTLPPCYSKQPKGGHINHFDLCIQITARCTDWNLATWNLVCTVSIFVLCWSIYIRYERWDVYLRLQYHIQLKCVHFVLCTFWWTFGYISVDVRNIITFMVPQNTATEQQQNQVQVY